MDWVVGMETRLAVALARRVDGEKLNVTALAAELGISRETFYVYERRFREGGLQGLLPRSRAPKRHPNQTPPEVEKAIVRWHHRLLADGWDSGAASIRARMLRAGEVCPSVRTVQRVLARRGLSQVHPRKRPRSSYRRFTAEAPNGIWQIDGMVTGLADGRGQVVIRILDDHSRKILASVVADTEDGAAAWACVSKAADRHGLPAMFLSDNGLAFNGSRKDRLVEVERRLRELGVAVVAASARHPQTCGKAEREHQTFTRWLAAQPPPQTPDELQVLCDAYEALYNTERPHQALGPDAVTPDEAYAATTKAQAARTALPTQARISRVKVTARGEVSVGSRIRVQIGRGWEGTPVEVIRDGNSVAIFHQHQLIEARIIDPNRRYQPRAVLSGN